MRNIGTAENFNRAARNDAIPKKTSTPPISARIKPVSVESEDHEITILASPIGSRFGGYSLISDGVTFSSIVELPIFVMNGKAFKATRTLTPPQTRNGH